MQTRLGVSGAALNEGTFSIWHAIRLTAVSCLSHHSRKLKLWQGYWNWLYGREGYGTVVYRDGNDEFAASLTLAAPI